MKFEDISRYRLANQRVAASKFTKPEQVATWLLAVQAQEYWGGKWSIGLRFPNATDIALERAVVQRRIARTWPMRGTIHFLAAQDVSWMVNLLAPRVTRKVRSYHRALGLTEAIINKSRKLIIKALKGTQLSRQEIYAVLAKAGIATHAMRGLFIMGYLAHEGTICFAAPKGKKPTFALLEEWVPRGTKRSTEQALAEVTLRYFTSHGPATMHDLAWWSGLTQVEIKAGLAAVGKKLRSEVIEGKTYWMAPKLPKIQKNTGKFYLLPTYDELVIGYKDRTALIAPADAATMAPAGNALFSSVFIDGAGKAAGTWRRKLTKAGISFTFGHFRKLTKAEQAQLNAAAERYAQFLGLKRV